MQTIAWTPKGNTLFASVKRGGSVGQQASGDVGLAMCCKWFLFALTAPTSPPIQHTVFAYSVLTLVFRLNYLKLCMHMNAGAVGFSECWRRSQSVRAFFSAPTQTPSHVF